MKIAAGMSLGELKAKVEYETRLIKEVKKREILYNRIYGEDNNAEKDEKWQEIANILDESATTIKSRWKNLRDRYWKMYYRLMENNLSGTNPTKWVHFGRMNFLSQIDELPTNEQILPDLKATTNSFDIPKIEPFVQEVLLEDTTEYPSSTNLDLTFDNTADIIVEDCVSPHKVEQVTIVKQENVCTVNASRGGAAPASRKRKFSDNNQNDLEILLNKLKCIIDGAATNQSPAVLGTHKFFTSLADKVLAAKLSSEEQMQLERETLDFVYTKLLNIQLDQTSN